MKRLLSGIILGVILLYMKVNARPSYIPWNQGKAKDVFQFCPPESLDAVSSSESPDPRCIQALQVVLPFDDSFEQSKAGEKAKKDIVELFYWLLSTSEWKLPADGLVLRQPNLKIPMHYLCILQPEAHPKECHLQPDLEPVQGLTLNHRLFHYLLSVIKRISYHSKPYLMNAHASGRADFGGRIHLYPLFFENLKSIQIATLFHETQHFALIPEGHRWLCRIKKHLGACDRGTFTGAYGAQLVMAEVLLDKSSKDIAKELHAYPFLLGPLGKMAYMDDKFGDWATFFGREGYHEEFTLFCSALNAMVFPPHLPVELQNFCLHWHLFQKKVLLLIQHHPEIFPIDFEKNPYQKHVFQISITQARHEQFLLSLESKWTKLNLDRIAETAK